VVITLLALLALLAFANGSNDNSKGVATLVGYGSATPRQALLWAAVTTAIGAAISFWAAAGLIRAFSGGGLFAAGITLGSAFFVAVLIGAVGWVFFANFTGLPVSTTHAITGALCGAGMLSFGSSSVQWSILGQKFAVPLAVSPVLSLAVVYVVSFPVSFVIGRVAGKCACVVVPELAAVAVGGDAAVLASPQAAGVLVVGSDENCDGAVGISGSATANAAHWISSGLVGFARGWNDCPKIAALAIGALEAAKFSNGTAIAFAIVTVAMAAGGWLAGRKVLETLATKVTTMPLAESLTASFVTATLVSLASWMALPVSTTHVSTGAIIGVGLKHDPRGVKWGKVGQIVLSWVVTLPVAAIIAAVATKLIH
jgi:PiT family inorganic phosphate transporter